MTKDNPVLSLAPGLKNFVEAGGESVEHFIKGIDEMRDTVKEAVKGIALAAVKTVKNAWADFKAAGKYVIDGLLNGIRDKKNALVDGAKNAANSILNAMENTLDINSPSKKTYQIGVYTMLGLINALKAMKNKLSAQTKNTINDGLLAPMNELVDETAASMWVSPSVPISISAVSLLICIKKLSSVKV